MKTTVGGDRLGSGNKQNISLKNYHRSTHDLSYLWRSSMSAGTLVPFMSEVGLPGDSFDIDLNAEVMTLPTVGPLFGSYKVQCDVFSVPIRLYNGKLHMNKLGIGLDMSQIKLPQVRLEAFFDPDEELHDNSQINSSCIFSYLNIRGIGTADTKGYVRREFNAIPYLGYWDIYKNYYANKQEEKGAMIHVAPGEAVDYEVVDAYRVSSGGTKTQIVSVPTTTSLHLYTMEVTLANGIGNPNWDEVVLTITQGGDAGDYLLDDLYSDKEIDGLVCTWSNYIGTVTGTQTYKIGTQNISADINPINDRTPQVANFDLANIDQMREDILSLVKNPTAYIIEKDTVAPYGNPMKVNEVDELCALEYVQEGLALKTYQSDLLIIG